MNSKISSFGVFVLSLKDSSSEKLTLLNSLRLMISKQCTISTKRPLPLHIRERDS